MMATFSNAIKNRNLFYEQVSNLVSAISGTIMKTMNIQLTDDYAIKGLRERAKTELLNRKETKTNKTCIDITSILESMATDDNETLSVKALRAKLSILLMIDSAARPSTLRAVLRGELPISNSKFGKVVTMTPHMTKDKHASKDKRSKPFDITAFPDKRNICTVSTLQCYLKRTASRETNDYEYSTTDEKGKPTSAHGTSIFVSINKPYTSIRATTIASEAKKYLKNLVGGSTATDIRHSVPSIIQFIDGLPDDQIATAFRWHREDTYKSWYKSVVPTALKDQFKDVPFEIPHSWKIRFPFVHKTKLQQLIRAQYVKPTNTIEQYLNKEN